MKPPLKCVPSCASINTARAHVTIKHSQTQPHSAHEKRDRSYLQHSSMCLHGSNPVRHTTHAHVTQIARISQLHARTPMRAAKREPITIANLKCTRPLSRRTHALTQTNPRHMCTEHSQVAHTYQYYAHVSVQTQHNHTRRRTRSVDRISSHRSHDASCWQLVTRKCTHITAHAHNHATTPLTCQCAATKSRSYAIAPPCALLLLPARARQ
jgi:hypothetical protein